ncbi:MAG: hypothetical protein NZ765_11590 [Anaerolineae bacterium]|nr:hypothetical protein [Anaerolineae bacterium]MDW8072249.1 hypothetical protein [Anaerolineae bacterium]
MKTILRELLRSVRARIELLILTLFAYDGEVDYSPYAEKVDVAGLQRLTERLHAALVPVSPRAEFQARLKESLLAAASQRLAAERESRIAALRRRWMLIGAAAGSLSMLSVAGIVAAVLLHQRTIRL